MFAARRLLAQRHLAALFCAAALLLKVLIPGGYMVDGTGGTLRFTICSGSAPAAMAMAMPDMRGAMPGHGRDKGHGKAEMPCAFAGLSAASLAATDPIQLAALLIFIVGAGYVLSRTLPPAGRTHLRPPLRGPPARR